MHTVRKSEIVSKNSIFRKIDKIVNLKFGAKNEWIWVILKLWFQLEFEFSRQKLPKFQDFQFFQFLFLIKIMIFGAKIQIIQGIFALNIFQNIIDFHSKPQNYNFVFFRKLNFWT